MDQENDDSDTKNTTSLSTSGGGVQSLVQDVLDEIDIITTQQNGSSFDYEDGMNIHQTDPYADDGNSNGESSDNWDWIPAQMRANFNSTIATTTTTTTPLFQTWPQTTTEIEQIEQKEKRDRQETGESSSPVIQISKETSNNLQNNYESDGSYSSNVSVSLDREGQSTHDNGERQDRVGSLPAPTSEVMSESMNSSSDSFQLPCTTENASYPKTLSNNFSSTAGIDFLKDDPAEMTRSRRIAMKLVGKRWYNPNAGKETEETLSQKKLKIMEAGSTSRQTPSLKRAWAYFEHVTLTRYIVQDHNVDIQDMSAFRKFLYSYKNKDEEFERALPGEKNRQTKLYDYITTPHKQLGDFGLGFGLYFSTLRAIAYILFVAGFISIFNIYFFSSDFYDDSDYSHSGVVNNLLKGSAVCTKIEWVPCIDCSCTNKTQGWNRVDRCVDFDSDNATKGALIVKNLCLTTEDDHQYLWILGLINYAVLIFLVLAIYVFLDFHLDKETVLFDEDEQTAQDYSILIKNPPPGATEPDEWRRYFESTFPVKVVAVTCNVNNDLLIKALVARRETLRRMELQLDEGISMDIDNLALLAAKEAETRGKYVGPIKGFFFPGLPELLSKLVALNTIIKGSTQLGYPCTGVYVTFEKESHQRLVMSKLAVGKRYIRNNVASALEDPKYMFQERVLSVLEPPEPNSVRWQDLNAVQALKLKEHTFTTLFSFATIYVCSLIVVQVDELGSGLGTAFTISALNLGYPELAKFITDFESHTNESKVQTSLYVKIAAFRWVNTAIVITVITPFTQTLSPSPGLISQIAAIFFAEIVTTNVIQLTDVWGHLQKHFFAPRAKTQDAMNIWFKGMTVELAERYTNLTKIMFLAFWYSSIFPGGLLFAAVALAVNYYTDRFSMMRSWQRAPRVGKEVATFSRHYFVSSACIFLAVMSSFYWAAFPFDNLCPTDEKLDSSYFGPHEVFDPFNITDGVKDEYFINLDENNTEWRYCNQDFILRSTLRSVDFPFIYKEGEEGFGEWMTDEQKILSKLFGWTSVAVIALVVLKFLRGIYMKIRRQFRADVELVGDVQEVGFHDVRNIAGYVPQVRSTMFSYPLVLCKTNRIDPMFDWTDPDLEYEYYDLTKDADHVLTGLTHPGKDTFDRVKYWSPNAVRDLKARKRRIEEKARTSRNIFNTSSATSGLRGGSSCKLCGSSLSMKKTDSKIS